MEYVPVKTISYWASEALLQTFKNNTLGDVGYAYQGIITGKVEYFLKFWHEIKIDKIYFEIDDYKKLESIEGYFPYVKGGEFRRWYGNLQYVLRWEKMVVNLQDLGQKIESIFFDRV